MEKKKLINFISKYTLGGLVTSVKVKSSENKLLTTFGTEDKLVLGFVAATGIEFPECEIGIFNTNQLVKLLNALDSDINLKLVGKAPKFKNLVLSDKTLSATFVLADLDVIPDAPVPKHIPDPTFTTPITPELISKFTSAKNALSDANSFSFVQEGNEIKLIINYDDHNTDRISLDLGIEYSEPFDTMKFDANKFLSILTANKDCTSGKLLLSEQGLLTLQFVGDGIQSKYYVVALQNN